ncbi:MAG: L-serine ammonia-lyase, iron-sulfur-dependent subunit beta [Bacteroidia bacterium]
MSERSSIFDMIGPVMIGPSSSHTAGVVRIGRVARKLLGESSRKAKIIFYNSFAKTYEGHGSDRAIVAGLLDMHTDDERIREAFDHAEKAKFEYSFKAIHHAAHHHPNSIRIELFGDTRKVEVLGVSRGGGLISIKEVDGFSSDISAQHKIILIKAKDQIGSISFLANVVSKEDCNIGTMTVNRHGKNDMAQIIMEIDSPLRELTVEYMKSLAGVKEVLYLPDIDL